MAEALELLRADEKREKSFISNIWAPVLGGTVGFLSICFVNYGTKRPWFSGIQKHIITAGGFGLACSYIDKYREGYLAERDAVLRHYVELHPEDFVAEARKKYGEILEPWTPIR